MIIRFAAALLALAVLLTGAARAHEGHDHGAAPPLTSTIGARAEAVSGTFELVAIPRGSDLVLFLDRFDTNEPVRDAQLEVATPDGPAVAEPRPDGGYRLSAPWLARGGDHELRVTVVAAGTREVLALDLNVPSPAKPAAAPAESPTATLIGNLRAHLTHQGAPGAAFGGFLLGLSAIMLARARLAAPAFALIALTLSLLLGSAALAADDRGQQHAHEGHEHGDKHDHDHGPDDKEKPRRDEKRAERPGDKHDHDHGRHHDHDHGPGEKQKPPRDEKRVERPGDKHDHDHHHDHDHGPGEKQKPHRDEKRAERPLEGALTDLVPERSQRLSDGAVFVPKSTQHLLGLRTALTAATAHRRAVELPGRIIADPNASGVVQSSVGGRLSPPQGGFPNLGTRVTKGDLLATVTPPVQAVDASDMRQTQGNLDQQIDVMARRVARYEKLAASGTVARTTFDDAKAELDGLKDRRAALDTIRAAPEALVAPVDGVVAERAAVAGQMAASGTMVFRIVDPQKLFVEALSFEALEPDAEASARLADGRVLRLAYRGAGLADREQAVPVQFAILGDTDGLRLGQFATVLAPTGATVEGLAVPRASVLRSEAGSVVYEHVAAERFAMRPVKVEPLDAERVIVAGGLTEGRRVVTQGAELIDQVR